MELVDFIRSIEGYGATYECYCDTQTSLFFISGTTDSGQVFFAIDADQLSAAERVLRRVEAASQSNQLW